MIYQHTNPSIKPSEIAGVYLLVDFQSSAVPEMILVNTHLDAAIALIGHAIKRTYRPDLICNGVTFPIAQTEVQTGTVLDVYVECVKRVDDLIPEDIDGVFNHEDFNEVVTADQARSIFLTVLKASSDITYDLIADLCKEYSVDIDDILPPAPIQRHKITPSGIVAALSNPVMVNGLTNEESEYIFLSSLKSRNLLHPALITTLCMKYGVDADTLYPKIVKQDRRSGKAKEISLVEAIHVLNGSSHAHSYTIKKD